MREHVVVSFLTWKRWLSLPQVRWNFSLRIGYNRRELCSGKRVSPELPFRLEVIFLTSTASSSIKLPEKGSSNFRLDSSTSFFGTGFHPAGSCLIVGVAFCSVTATKGTNRIDGAAKGQWSKTQYRRRMCHQLQVKVSAELEVVKHSPLSWNRRCHSRAGSPSSLLSVAWFFFFFAERESFLHHVQGSTHVDHAHFCPSA